MNQSESELDLESLRADWQGGSANLPATSLVQLRRRLRWRWLGLVGDILALAGIGALLIWVALNATGISEWIYWGYFTAGYLVAGTLGLRLRLASLWRRDESAAAILEHAWRDADLRQRSGRLGIWFSAITLVFVVAWLISLGLAHQQPVPAYLLERWAVLGFVGLWCGVFLAAGAWLREKGRRQKLELDRLRQDLET